MHTTAIQALINQHPIRVVGLTLLACVALSACATDDPNRRTKIGAGIGAVAGVVIGNQVGGREARIVGGTLGALAGGAVGRYQDNQQRALEKALAEESRQRQVAIDRLENDVLRVSLSSSASFDINSARVKRAFEPALSKLAKQMADYDKTMLHVVGFTDDTGTESYNYRLSNQRASAVANSLLRKGVPSSRLQVEGRGESEPRMPNTSAENRALNRRVEIYIKPVVEGYEAEALKLPNRRYN